jgi:hypothetical protein
MIPRRQCRHEELTFGSGDYYLFCNACGATWMTKSVADAQHGEFGVTKDGRRVGGCPQEANKGEGALLSGRVRYSRD